MARFYFHLRNDMDETLDPDGIDCADLETVAVMTLRMVRDVIAGEAITGLIDLTHRLDVEDAAGTIVHTLAFEDAVTIRHRSTAA